MIFIQGEQSKLATATAPEATLPPMVEVAAKAIVDPPVGYL